MFKVLHGFIKGVVCFVGGVDDVVFGLCLRLCLAWIIGSVLSLVLYLCNAYGCV